MFPEAFVNGLHILASIILLAIMSSLVYLAFVLLSNYLLGRNGASVRTAGWIFLLPAGVLMGISVGTWALIALFFVLAWSYYWVWHRRFSIQKIFWVNALVISGLVGISVVLYFVFFDWNVTKIVAFFDEAMASSGIDWQSLGVATKTDKLMVKEQIKKNLLIAKMIYPGLVFFYGVMVSLLMLPIMSTFWRRFHGSVPAKSNYLRFRLPDYAIFILLGGIALVVWYVNQSEYWLGFLGWNILMIILLFYALQGGAVSIHYIHKWQMQRFFFFVTLFLLLFLGSYLVVALYLLWGIIGVADFWLDARGLQKPGSV